MPQQPDTSFDDDLKAARASFEADLADARQHVDAGKDVPHPLVSKLLDWLPTVGGAAGGFIGGAGGTAFGMGVGGVPGAVGGAAVGGATGEALKQVGQYLIGDPKAHTSAVQAAKDIALQGGVQGGSELVGGTVVAPLMKRGASVLMQSALKPGAASTAKALIKGVANEDLPVIKTMLKEGVNVSPSGIQKLTDVIGASNDELTDMLAQARGKIYPAKVAQRADAVEQSFSSQVNKRADVAAVRGVKQEFVEDNVRDAAGRLRAAWSPLKAQEMKTGTYAALGKKAYTGELKGAEVEAQKALARGIKEDIESVTANQGLKSRTGRSVAEVNAREGAAIEAREAIAKRVAVAGNRDPVALAWLAHNPAASLAFIVERSPAVKSMLARGLYTSASRAARVPENVIRTVVAALAASGED